MTEPSAPAPPPRRRGRMRAVVLALAIVTLVGGAAAALRTGSGFGSGSTDRSGPVGGARAAPTPAPTPAAQDRSRAGVATVDAAARREALADLLAERGRAVLRKDATAFLATVDPQAPEFRAAQARLFDNLVRLPLATWSPAVLDEGPQLTSARRAALGGDAWLARVVIRQRLRGYDSTDVASEQMLTVVRRNEDWLLAGDSDGPADPARTHDLWELGAVSVLSGKRSLVVGLGPREQLQRYAQEADAAVPTVTAVWGRAWPQRVVVLVPTTRQQMAKVLGAEPSELSQIAAVTTGHLGVGSRRRSADRVVINPEAFAQLRAVGRRVVLAHEVTHVASRAVTDESVPLWLSEGFADYVAYRDAGIPVSLAAGEALRDVRAGRLPSAFPEEADFARSSPGLAAAYERSWLACRFIAEREGDARLARFYAAVGASARPSAAAVDLAARRELGMTSDQLLSAWRAWLERLA